MKNYRFKKTFSARQFISELGSNFSTYMKNRLNELGTRCVFTRKENNNLRFDLKHVEHTQYACGDSNGSDGCQKEYAYGQFVINDGKLYFSESCIEDTTIEQAPVVDFVYQGLNGDRIFVDEGISAKEVDDTNIDYIVDSILEVCPEVTPEHMAIIARYRDAGK
jgi:hypothetical protein